MAFVQKYKTGRNLVKELKDSTKEYVVEDVNKIDETIKVPETISPQPIIKPSTDIKTNDKITINGVDINKKLLIDNLKKKSFTATGLNRVAWDKILGKLENLSEYNSSNSLDVDYGSDLKYNTKDLEDRGNLVLSEILKEASSDKYSYKKEENKTPFTFSRFLGSEVGLGRDFNYATDFDILKSFEEDQYEPEYTKNKKTGLEEVVKNKYTTNLSTVKRAELISRYLDKEIENVINDPDDNKYIGGTVDKTEYLNRLNEAKNVSEQLKRTKTIKNAAPEFYRIGIDVNKLFNAQQQNNDTSSKETTNTDGSKTLSTTNTNGSRTDTTTYPNGSQIAKNYDKDGNEIKEDNTKKEEAAPVTNSKLFSTKPKGLPEHMLKSDYRSYIINSVKNPFIPGSTQWVNWFDNPFSNPYDSKTQPKEYAEWDKSVKGKTLEYSFSRPEGLKESIPSLEEIRKIDPSIKDWGDYIFKAKENPFDYNLLTEVFTNNNASRINTKKWNQWKENPKRIFNPFNVTTTSWDLWNKKYKRSPKTNVSINEETYKAATKDELNRYWTEYSKSNPKKGKLGLKIQPYSILSPDYEKYNKLIKSAKSNDFNTYYRNNQLNQNKGKINLLDNFIFPINTDKVTNNNSIIENKNSIKHIPEEEKLKTTTENKSGIGSSTIIGASNILSNLIALNINKNIANEYKNSLQTQVVTPRQFTSAKVYQDPSNSNKFEAFGNTMKPMTSDINAYQGVKRDFNKQLGEYLLKEQVQQATGIRQDREKVGAIQNEQLKENSRVANLNEASRIALNNKIAEINMGSAQKRGEITLDLLSKLGDFAAGYVKEKAAGEQQLDLANYNTELTNLTKEKDLIEKDTTLNFKQKTDALLALNDKEKNINKKYMTLLKGKYNSYFPKWSITSESPKTDVFK